MFLILLFSASRRLCASIVFCSEKKKSCYRYPSGLSTMPSLEYSSKGMGLLDWNLNGFSICGTGGRENELQDIMFSHRFQE
jgi:hypothetical protein